MSIRFSGLGRTGGLYLGGGFVHQVPDVSTWKPSAAPSALPVRPLDLPRGFHGPLPGRQMSFGLPPSLGAVSRHPTKRLEEKVTQHPCRGCGQERACPGQITAAFPAAPLARSLGLGKPLVARSD